MPERILIALKLVLTHILLLPVLVLGSYILNRDLFLSISIIQTILIILYFSGYWEFFGLKFRVIYAVIIELILLIEFFRRMTLQPGQENNRYLVYGLLFLQAYMLYGLIKIFITIYKK
jgi:hypothetical protein